MTLPALPPAPAALAWGWLETRAKRTRKKYRGACGRLAAFAGLPDATALIEASVTNGVAWTSDLLARFAAARLREGKAPATVLADLGALESILGMLRRLGVIAWAPMRPRIRPERRHPRTGPSQENVARLVEHLATRATSGEAEALRDLAVVRLLHGAGLRREEIVSLERANVLLGAEGGPAVRVVRKGRREPVQLAIGPAAAESLARWLVRATRDGLLPNGRAFPWKDGKSVWVMVRNRSRECGLPVMRPHGFRHRGATEAAKLGLPELMAYGGWRDLKSAQFYLDDQEQARRDAIAKVEL